MNSQEDISTLLRQLSAAKHDTTKCNLLIRIAEDLYYSKPDTVKPLCEEVISIVDKNLWSANEAERKAFLIAKGSALTDIGIIEGRSGNYDKEIFYNLESIKIQKETNNKIGLASSYNNLGIVYSNVGDISKAIDYSFSALKLQEQVGDREGQALSLNNIGYNFKLIGEYQKALDYYNKSLRIHQDIKSYQGEAMTLNNIANIYEKNGVVPCNKSKAECIRLGQIKALEIYKKCYSLQQKTDDKIGMAYTLNNIAISYKNLGDPESAPEDKQKSGRKIALDYFMQSFEIHKQLDNKRGVAYVADNISNLYYLEHNLSAAEKFGKMSFELAKEAGEAEVILRSAATLKNIYSSQNNFREAFAMFGVETRMKDSLGNEKGRKALFQKSIQYNYEKKALADSLKAAEEMRTADLKLQKEVATKNSLMITVAGIVIVLIILSVLVFSLIRNIKERKQSYMLLEEKNIEIRNQSEKLVELSKQITRYQTQMNPHFVFNALNNIQGFVVNNEREKALKQLQSFSRLMRQTLNNSGSDTIDLKTEIEFLKLYVDFEAEKLVKPVSFNIRLNLSEEEILIPPMLIQPLIENSLKHAGLNDVEHPAINVSFTEQNDLLIIEVSDNGKGINENYERLFDRSHALGILSSRLKLIFDQENKVSPENNISVNSNNNFIPRGTSVKFTIPLILKY